jgi:hypothetical protein
MIEGQDFNQEILEKILLMRWFAFEEQGTPVIEAQHAEHCCARVIRVYLMS